jgi:hypothetical protein
MPTVYLLPTLEICTEESSYQYTGNVSEYIVELADLVVDNMTL